MVIVLACLLFSGCGSDEDLSRPAVSGPVQGT